MSFAIMVYVLFLLTGSAGAQGTLVYDQQSADESSLMEGGANIQPSEPIGQSFTPALSSIGFIRLFVYDIQLGNNIGATVYINLRTNSVSGPILASTEPVTMPD